MEGWVHGGRVCRPSVQNGYSAGADPGESDEGGNDEKRRGEKYKPVGQDISEHAHESSGRQAPGGLEALIAPESLGKGRLADEAQAHGRNSRPDESTRGPLQHQSDEDDGERWPKSDHQRAERYDNEAQAEHKPLRPNRIKQLPARVLRQQAGNTAQGQDKADALRGPTLPAEKERHERSETGQGSSHKEVDCVERP